MNQNNSLHPEYFNASNPNGIGGPFYFKTHGAPVTTMSTRQFGNASGSFPGTGYVDTPDNTAFDFGSSDFTIVFWIGSTTGNKVVMSKQSTLATNGWEIDTTTGNNGITFVDRDNTKLVSTPTTTSLTPPGFHQIVIERQGYNLTAYLDGVNSSLTMDGGTISPVANLTIGSYYDGSSGFTGYMDELAIWKNKAVPISSLWPQPYEVSIPAGGGTSTLSPTTGACPLV